MELMFAELVRLSRTSIATRNAREAKFDVSVSYSAAMRKSAKRGELGTPQIFLICVTLWASGGGASQKEKRKLIGDQTRAR
jgi:hypothetical protein